jgi:RHS repeat-associated protein
VGAFDPATLFTYNAESQLTRVARPDGRTVDLAYDAAGRVEGITIARGTYDFAYDPTTGLLAQISAPGGGTLGFTYAGSLPIETLWGGEVTGSVSQSFDTDGRLSSRSVNGAHTVAFSYDDDGLLTGAGAIALARDPGSGLLSGTTLGSVATSVTYNAFGEREADEGLYGAASLYRNVYTRDRLGRITRKVETVEGVTKTFEYAYDLAGRLEQVKTDGAVTATYTYDANGNRLSRVTPSATELGTYDAQDRLLSYGTNVYTYTENGELRTKRDTATGETTAYTYDELGNLISVSLPDGRLIEYVIDAANRRIGKKVNGALVQGFLYGDQLNPVAELDGSGSVLSRFVYGSRPNVPDYMIRGGTTYRILSDHLGSPRLVVDATTGAIAQRLDYDEWGRVLLDTAPGLQPFGFAGGVFDADTGWVRFGARDYDPGVGRWMVKDPIDLAGLDTNLYGCVYLDPLNDIDQTGIITQRDVANLSAGLGDALLLGLGKPLRDLTGDEGFVDECSDAYRYGSYAALFAGGARLAYAAIAKAAAATLSSGVAANAFRNGLKRVFRGSLARSYRSLSYSRALERYGSDAAVRAAAGRTNLPINAYATGVAVTALGGNGCGCSGEGQ